MCLLHGLMFRKLNGKMGFLSIPQIVDLTNDTYNRPKKLRVCMTGRLKKKCIIMPNNSFVDPTVLALGRGEKL